MIRLLVLLLLFAQISSAQNPTFKFTYEQSVTQKSTGERFSTHVDGLLNSFQPFMLSFVESTSDFERIIFVEKAMVYVENYQKDQEGLFSSKLENNDGVFYLNRLTGEQKRIKAENLSYLGIEVPTRFKLKKKESKDTEQLEIYRAENSDMRIEYHVSTQLELKSSARLSKNFLYKDKVIIKSSAYIKSKDKLIINELISIDTLEDNALTVHLNRDKEKELKLENQAAGQDSLDFNEEMPNIYIGRIGSDSIILLNKYKGNGKYLMVDFWGTWCKPCLASIPELKAFYEEHSDQIDLLALNYNDANETRVAAKIREYEMDWDHGSVSERVLKVLNPSVYFPGILLFDDQMRLIVRDRTERALVESRRILTE